MIFVILFPDFTTVQTERVQTVRRDSGRQSSSPSSLSVKPPTTTPFSSHTVRTSSFAAASTFLMSCILCTPLSWTPFPCLNSIIWLRPPYFFRYLHPHVDIFRMPYLGTARPKERTCQPWGTLFQYRLGENRSRNPCCSDCWQGSPIFWILIWT